MSRKKHTRKELNKSGLGLNEPTVANPTISTVSIRSHHLHEELESPHTSNATGSSDDMKKRRRRRKKLDSEELRNTDYPEDDIVRAVRMLESDVVLGTVTSRTKGADIHNVIMQSKPVEKIFVENDRGFKAFDNLENMFPSKNERAIFDVKLEDQLLEVAVSTDRWMYSFAFICRGLLAGLSLCQMIIILHQPSPCYLSSDLFAQYSICFSPVLHSCWCFLLTICTVSVLDRIDVKKFKERHLWCFADSSFISVLLYSVSLLVTLGFTSTQEKLAFYNHRNITDLWDQDARISEVEIWQTSRLAVSTATVIGWFLVGVHLHPEDLPPYLIN